MGFMMNYAFYKLPEDCDYDRKKIVNEDCEHYDRNPIQKNHTIIINPIFIPNGYKGIQNTPNKQDCYYSILPGETYPRPTFIRA